MTPMKSFLQFAMCTALLLMVTGSAGAQVVSSGAQAITLNANLSDSISLTLSSNSVSFVLTAGSATNSGSTGVTATTNWVSRPGRDVHVYAYFASATSALTDGVGDNIPSSAFSISNNGGAYAPLNTTVPFGGGNAGREIFTVKITGLNKVGTHADSMLFNIDLSAIPQLPAGIYAGTLNIQAQVI
jgi:hypothetical protein